MRRGQSRDPPDTVLEGEISLLDQLYLLLLVVVVGGSGIKNRPAQLPTFGEGFLGTLGDGKEERERERGEERRIDLLAAPHTAIS